MQIYSTCKAGSRCGDFRRCPDCAKKRQAKYAQAFREASNDFRLINYAVFRFASCRTLPDRFVSFLSRLKKHTLGGLYSVEIGETTGLTHVNIVFGLQGDTAVFRSLLGDCSPDLSYLTSPPRGDAPTIAAYSLKRGQIPSLVEFSGRTVSTWGNVRRRLSKTLPESPKPRRKPSKNFRKPVVCLAEHPDAAVVSAAALQYMARKIIGYKNGIPILSNPARSPSATPAKVTKYLSSVYSAAESPGSLAGWAYKAGYGIIFRPETI